MKQTIAAAMAAIILSAGSAVADIPNSTLRLTVDPTTQSETGFLNICRISNLYFRLFYNC